MPNSRPLLRATLFLAVAIASSSPAAAQGGLGSISGTVTDKTGAAIPGADVRMTEISTNAHRATRTNEAGLFSIPSLVIGRYTLSISATGFKTRSLPEFSIESFQQMSLGEVVLEVGEGPAATVTVTAEAPILAETHERSGVITDKEITDSPLPGRNWSVMLRTIPGSIPTTEEGLNGRNYSADGFGDFMINGKAGNQTQVNLDGGSIVDHGNDVKTTVAPSIESVQEVAVLTNNYQAEYGERGGTVINIVTKGGTNRFQGTLFNYLRNEALNANTWANNYLGTPRQAYKYNYFGGNIGGPIRKNRLFFFYNFENFKQSIPGTQRLTRVPTELERQGDFSQTIDANGNRPAIYLPGTRTPLPNRTVPAELLDPLGLKIMDLYPLPNNPGEPNNNYIFRYQSKAPRISNTGKIDWVVDSKTRAYFRYTEDQGATQGLITYIATGTLPLALVKQPRPDRAYSANVTRTIGARLVSETSTSWSFDDLYSGLDDAVYPKEILKSTRGLSKLPLVYETTNDVLPAITTSTYANFHFNRFPIEAKLNHWQASSKLSYLRGKHVFKFGVNYIRYHKEENNSTNDKGTFNFTVNTSSPFDMNYAPANMATGALNNFGQTSPRAHTNAIYSDVHFFAQDTYRVRRNLTLDYGVRFYHIPSEHNLDPTDTLDGVFVPARWDPAKAPRYYVKNPLNPSQVIDPARPDQPLPASVATLLLYSLVPDSGDPYNGVVPLNSNGIGMSGLPNPPFLMAAPRGGFAWSPFRGQKTVIRGGFGWTYNRNSTGESNNAFSNAYARSVSASQTSIAMLSLGLANSVQRLSPRNFGVWDPTNTKRPTIYDYSLSLQRLFPGRIALDVAYVGNLQRHQPITFNINAVRPGTAFLPEFVEPGTPGYNFRGTISASNPGPALPGSNSVPDDLMRPYRGLGNLNLPANVANARHHALQTSIARRYSHGLAMQASYTLSKTYTQRENPGLYNDNWKAYTGFLAASNRTHVFKANYTYDLPRFAKLLGWKSRAAQEALNGWSLAHFFSLLSGPHYTPTFSIQMSGNSSGFQNLARVFTGTSSLTPRLRPTGDVEAGAGGMRFNPAALAPPPIYPEGDGTGSMNYLTQPSTFGNDISLTKRVRLRESKAIEFRLSAYNAFNNTRRTRTNASITYKAQGANWSDGFYVYNTGQQIVDRLPATSRTTPRQIFDFYRGGVGLVDLTTVSANRIVEIGMRFRF